MLLPKGSVPHIRPCQCGGIYGEFTGTAGGIAVLAPDGDGVVFQGVHAAPAGEGQQRIVIGVPHHHPFQSVMVGVSQHGAQRVQAVLPEDISNW